MKESMIIMILNMVGIMLTFFSIVYAAGVVWRVEKKLDISYKLFLAAILVYAVSLFLELFNVLDATTMELYISITKVLFIALFLGGVLTMRDLVRELDGEKEQLWITWKKVLLTFLECAIIQSRQIIICFCVVSGNHLIIFQPFEK